MKLSFSTLGDAFDARSSRERAVMIAAGVIVIVALGWRFGLEPQLRQQRVLEQRIAQQRTDLQTLGPELDALRTRQHDPDAARKAQLEQLRLRLARLDDELAQLNQSLVAPREMGRLIEGLLKQHGGLQVVGLRSLPVTPLDERTGATPFATAAAATAASASGARTTAPDDAWLYLHGMQITVQGSYADMQAYLEALERLPRRVVWGAVTIDAQAWPASVMTVTLYTVSLERTWWSV